MLIIEAQYHPLQYHPNSEQEEAYDASEYLGRRLAEHGITNTELWSRGIDLARFSPDHRSAGL